MPANSEWWQYLGWKHTTTALQFQFEVYTEEKLTNITDKNIHYSTVFLTEPTRMDKLWCLYKENQVAIKNG